eukprot:TRINITY_DN26317_c0_g6_i2.p1 TRINITY_DN26317_c0_g6~~TRINITY_DN26317_c0_g6_i2.p1  ORF type:complete len:809 (+),score=40.28 TRINITY_DN26317_c0_g6_i2:185-2611(+)
MRSNKFTGGIPESIGSLVNVDTLNFCDNQLTQSIPASIGSMVSLRYLYLDRNQLSGEIPDSITSLVHLRDLELDDNKLSGKIPASMGSMIGLKTLWLHDNQLSGGIPNSFNELINLVTLNLSDNQLTGDLPDLFASCSLLQELLLARNQLSGGFPAGLPASLRILDIGGNRFSGSITAAPLRHLVNLTHLGINDNRFRGHFPAVESQRLQRVIAQDNYFSGGLPNLTQARDKRLVFLHSNFFDGPVDDLGSGTLQVLLALPGNYLSGPAEHFEEAEPFLREHAGAMQLLDREDAGRLLSSAVALGGVMWLIFLLRAYRRRTDYSTATAVSAVVLERSVTAVRRLLTIHAAPAVLCMALCGYSDRRVHRGRQILKLTTTYCIGWNMALLFGLALPVQVYVLRSLRRLPRHPSALGSRSKKTSPWKRLTTWATLVMICLLCGVPATLNSFILSNPSSSWQLKRVQPWLPMVGTFMQVFLQNNLISRLAAMVGTSAYKLQALQGMSIWVLPVMTTGFLSNSCYGFSWSFFEACAATLSWTCGDPARPVHPLKCTSERPLDVSAVDLCSYLSNRTHCMRPLLSSTEDVCGQRFARPAACTTAVIDAVGSFIFWKLVAACLFTPALLLSCLFARREHPWWLPIRFQITDEPEAEARSLVILCGGCQKTILDLSRPFRPTSVVQRLAVWSDLALGWGLLCPPIALAGLLNVHIEIWTYNQARECFNFPPLPAREVFQLPSSTMVFWYMVATVLAALHFGSVVEDDPGLGSVAIVLGLVAMCWIAAFFPTTYCCEYEDSAESCAQQDVELVTAAT